MENERKNPAEQFKPEEGTKQEEDGKIKVEDEVDNRKKLEMQKKDITKDMRKLEGTNCTDAASKTVLTEGWQKGARANRTVTE